MMEVIELRVMDFPVLRITSERVDPPIYLRIMWTPLSTPIPRIMGEGDKICRIEFYAEQMHPCQCEACSADKGKYDDERFCQVVKVKIDHQCKRDERIERGCIKPSLNKADHFIFNNREPCKIVPYRCRILDEFFGIQFFTNINGRGNVNDKVS